VPIEHRQLVRDNGRVPDGAWVAFFSWRGEPTIATGRFVSTDEAQTSAHDAVLASAGVGFVVKGFKRPEAAESLNVDVPPFRQLWPRCDSMIGWATPVAAERTLLPALINFSPARQHGTGALRVHGGRAKAKAWGGQVSL
jgi:hypothetical protein